MATVLDAYHGRRVAIPAVSRRRRWTGRVITTFAGLFLFADGVMKVTGLQPVVDPFNQLGYPSSQNGIASPSIPTIGNGTSKRERTVQGVRDLVSTGSATISGPLSSP